MKRLIASCLAVVLVFGLDAFAQEKNAKEKKPKEVVKGKEKDKDKDEPADVTDLVKDLRSRKPASRQKAVEKLTEMGEKAKDAAPALVEVLLMDQANKEHYLEALEKIHPTVFKHVSTILLKNDAEATLAEIDAIKESGPEAKACLPLLLSFYALDRQRPSENFELSQRVLPALVAVAPDDKKVISVVLGAVTTFDQRDANSAVRQKALEVLGDLQASPKDKAKALTLALNDPNCQAQTIEALGNMGKDASDAIPALKKLKFGPDETVREAAAAAMKRIQEGEGKDKEKKEDDDKGKKDK